MPKSSIFRSFWIIWGIMFDNPEHKNLYKLEVRRFSRRSNFIFTYLRTKKIIMILKKNVIFFLKSIVSYFY
jgi:hypothetical protein